MKCICLVGRYNTGKTKTINAVYQLLREGAKSICFENEGRKKDDIVAMLEFKGIRVGFISAGDSVEPDKYSKGMRNNFARIRKLDCQILLCACRTSRETKKWVMKELTPDLVLLRKPFLESDGNLEWFDFNRCVQEINEMTASYLANKIREFVNCEFR